MEIRFILCQMKKRTRRVSLSKLYHPTSEKTCLVFKGEFRGSVLRVHDKMHVPEQVLALDFISQFTGATSPQFCVLVDRGLLLTGQREIRWWGVRLSGLVEKC
jgi:hypothetical protein